MKLRLLLRGDKKDNDGFNTVVFNTEINAQNFKELSMILKDLKNLGLPIEKAIKEFNLIKSDWDAALGI